MPGSSPARACSRNWYLRHPISQSDGVRSQEKTLRRRLRVQTKRKKENNFTYPTQNKLANHSTSATSSHTTVLNRRRPRVATEGVQLEVRLAAHLDGESLVACDIQVRTAQYLVIGNALSCFDVAQDVYFWSERHSGFWVHQWPSEWLWRADKQVTITEH